MSLLLILNENNVKWNHELHQIAFRILEGQFSFGLTFDPYAGGRGIPSIIAKKEAHRPPLFFVIFTRRRIDLNSK